MNHTWKNGEKPNFGTNFSPFGPNLVLQKKICVSTLLVVSYCSKISSYTIEKKTNEPNLRKWQKNLISGPNFDPKIFFRGFYLYHMLHIVASYRHM